MNIRRLSLIIFFCGLLLGFVVNAQSVCEIEQTDLDLAILQYNTSLNSLRAAEISFRPVEQFFEANKDIISAPVEAFAESALEGFVTEELRNQLDRVSLLCRTSIITGAFCNIAIACVQANIALERSTSDWSCTIKDITRTQIAPIAVPAILVIYRDEFRDETENYERSLANLIEAEDVLNNALQARTKCYEQAQIYDQICEFGPPSRLAVGIYGEIRSSSTDADRERPSGTLNIPGQPIGPELRVAPTRESELVIPSVFIGSEFLITDGPVCANSVTWWQVALVNVDTGDISDGWVPEGNSTTYFMQPLLQNIATSSSTSEIVLATAVPGSNLLDLIFVIDTTGSMQDDINEVQRRALEIINQVAASGSDWRIGIVTFRDHPQAPYGDPGDYVAQLDLPFSSDQNQIVAGINRIVVGGGGDGPEAVFAGVLEAIGQPWRNGARKVVILMGDAPPHDPDPILGYTSETVLQAAYDVDPASIFPILIESANAVRFPFQVLADGSSGRLFYASNADEVVPTLLNTIALATGVQLSLGLEVQIASLEPDFPLQAAPSMRASTISRIPRSERATITDGPEVVFEMSADRVPQNFIWWKISTASGSEGWIQETYYGEPILVPFAADNPVVPASCILTTRGDVNIRSGPGLNYQQIASRAGEGNLLAANGQFGNIAVVQEHWWQLVDGFWIRNDQVRESEGCPSLPAVGVP